MNFGREAFNAKTKTAFLVAIKVCGHAGKPTLGAAGNQRSPQVSGTGIAATWALTELATSDEKSAPMDFKKWKTPAKKTAPGCHKPNVFRIVGAM